MYCVLKTMRKNTASCSGYLSQTHSQPSRRVWSFLFFQFLFLRLSPVPFWYFLFFPLLVFAFRFLSLLFHVLFLRFSLQNFNQPKKRKSADSQQNFLWWSPLKMPDLHLTHASCVGWWWLGKVLVVTTCQNELYICFGYFIYSLLYINM